MIIVAALTLGKIVTLAELGLIAGCYVWLAYPLERGDLLTLPYGTKLLTQIAPMLLVAYITSMLSADLRRAYTQVKHLSETDESTGVLNMRAFVTLAERVSRQAGRYARPFSVLIFESVLEKADQAMYASKAGGKNRITVSFA